MSFLSDLTHVVQDLGKLALCELSAEIMPLEIAQALSNAITQVVGQAIQQAVQQLQSQQCLPNFIARDIERLVHDIMRELQNPTNLAAMNSVNQQFGSQLSGFQQELTSSILQGMLQYAGSSQGSNGGQGASAGLGGAATTFGGGWIGGSGSGGWLIALAKCLGRIENQQAQKLQQMANAVQNNNNPGQVTQLSAQSELFGMMMNSFSNVLKTIGEALSSMASKQ